MRSFKAPSLAAMLLAILAGCATVPNVDPFVNASSRLSSAVSQSGGAVEDELRRIEGGAPHADNLKTQWKARAEAAEALVAYSLSLQSVASAGRGGAQSVGEFADSVTTLAETVGLSTTPVVGTLVDIAKKVYQHIAAARAAKSLGEALEAAQPAIDEIADLLAEDYVDLGGVLRTVEQALLQTQEEDYEDRLKFRARIENRFDALYVKDPTCATATNCLEAADREEMLELHVLLEITDTWYGPYQDDRAEIARRLRLARELVDASSRATRSWAAAHAQLGVALRAKQPINPVALTQEALEIKHLVERIREL